MFESLLMTALRTEGMDRLIVFDHTQTFRALSSKEEVKCYSAFPPHDVFVSPSTMEPSCWREHLVWTMIDCLRIPMSFKTFLFRSLQRSSPNSLSEWHASCRVLEEERWDETNGILSETERSTFETICFFLESSSKINSPFRPCLDGDVLCDEKKITVIENGDLTSEAEIFFIHLYLLHLMKHFLNRNEKVLFLLYGIEWEAPYSWNNLLLYARRYHHRLIKIKAGLS